MRVLYNKFPAQRNQDCSDEVVEVVDSAAYDLGDDGDSRSLGDATSSGPNDEERPDLRSGSGLFITPRFAAAEPDRTARNG
jgi:hypothetical protein